MKISLVAAMSENRIIGDKGTLPWHLPDDLKHFKRLTLKKNVLMGRKTLSSLSKPLPHRQNYVLTRNRDFSMPHVTVFHSVDEVMNYGFDEVMVIGGEEIFRLFLPYCQTLYLTVVHAKVFGDVVFPEFEGFQETSREYHDKDDKHQLAFSFIRYERKAAFDPETAKK